MAGYELIYPTGCSQKNRQYETYLRKAQELWDDFNLGKQKNKQRMLASTNRTSVVKLRPENVVLKPSMSIERLEKTTALQSLRQSRTLE